MPTKKTKLASLILDAGTDVRSEINEAVVEEYGDAARNGATFPPLIAFSTKDGLLLADGFHRYYGFEREGIKEWEVDIRQGTRLDALTFALGCNNDHGYRRTNADKRNAVEIALREFPGNSDRMIADMCHVSNTMVGDVRKSLSAPAPAPATPPQRPASTQSSPKSKTDPETQKSATPPPRKGKDGKTYSQKQQMPPVKSKTVDATNHPVPEEIIPYWDSSIAEANKLLGSVSELRTRIKAAADRNEPMFREVTHNDVIAKLDLVYAELKLAKPYAVCIDCQGVNTKGCPSCKGRGFVSQLFWDTCVPAEIKQTAGRE